MQGSEAPGSIAAAFDKIARCKQSYHLAALIRGGGAAADLYCFDDYKVAAAIASCKFPVITGIGHDRDTSLADTVSYASLKTPTAAAEFIIAASRGAEEKLADIELLMNKRCLRILNDSSNKLEAYELVMPKIVSRFFSLREHELNSLGERARRSSSLGIKLASANLSGIFSAMQAARKKQLGANCAKLDYLCASAKKGGRSSIAQQEKQLEQYGAIMLGKCQHAINAAGLRLSFIEQNMQAANPLEKLKKGYVLAFSKGKRVKNTAQLALGDSISLVLYDGKAEARLLSVSPENRPAGQ
jgi:exodeoxyribonuclease VII large subunit